MHIVYMYNRLIGLVGRVFVKSLGDLGSIPDRVIPKTFKIVLSIQHYKVKMKGSEAIQGKG